MSSIPLQLLKQHVRADDFADDDQYLQHLLDSAEVYIIRATQRTASELVQMGGGTLPLPLQQAVLLCAGSWYANREGVSAVPMRTVPDACWSLVQPYRALAPGGDGLPDGTGTQDAPSTLPAPAECDCDCAEKYITDPDHQLSVADIAALTGAPAV